MFLGVYTIPTLVTYLGLLCSFLSCAFAINGKLDIAVVLFIFAGIFDLFDGVIARKLNSSEKERIFGIQIDSIIDVFSFGITPIVLALSIGMHNWFDFGIFFLYICVATMRLAYFNYLVIENNEEGPVKHYTGLPVTYSALIFPIMYVVTNGVDENVILNIIRGTFLLVSLLYILKIKIAKPKGIFYLIFPLLAVIFSILSIILL